MTRSATPSSQKKHKSLTDAERLSVINDFEKF